MLVDLKSKGLMEIGFQSHRKKVCLSSILVIWWIISLVESSNVSTYNFLVPLSVIIIMIILYLSNKTSSEKFIDQSTLFLALFLWTNLDIKNWNVERFWKIGESVKYQGPRWKNERIWKERLSILYKTLCIMWIPFAKCIYIWRVCNQKIQQLVWIRLLVKQFLNRLPVKFRWEFSFK